MAKPQIYKELKFPNSNTFKWMPNLQHPGVISFHFPPKKSSLFFIIKLPSEREFDNPHSKKTTFHKLNKMHLVRV